MTEKFVMLFAAEMCGCETWYHEWMTLEMQWTRPMSFIRAK